MVAEKNEFPSNEVLYANIDRDIAAWREPSTEVGYEDFNERSLMFMRDMASTPPRLRDDHYYIDGVKHYPTFEDIVAKRRQSRIRMKAAFDQKVEAAIAAMLPVEPKAKPHTQWLWENEQHFAH